MSRAFVEETDDNFDDVPAIKDPLPPGVKNYMTPEGAAKLREELQELQNEKYPRLQQKLSLAVKRGEDLKEEAQVNMRRSLREMERRIEYLQIMLEKLEVVNSGNQDSGNQDSGNQDSLEVHFGARVCLRERNAEKKWYRIVGIDESSPAEGRISWISPLARSLLSKRVGDVVRLDLPAGGKTYRVVAIEYP
jgi:transcription elongation factor GreB